MTTESLNANGLPCRRPLVAGLLSTLVSESQYDFWARELGTTAAWRRVWARVASVRGEGRDTLSLVLAPNRNLAAPRPGQHLSLSVEIGGRRHSRSYSVSRPAPGGQVCISVRREPGGLVSNYLHDQLRIGDVVELSQPYGELGDGLSEVAPTLFLAAGSGITAIYNLIAAQACLGAGLNGELWYWEKHQGRFCYVEELKSLAAAHPGFTLRFISRENSGRQQGGSPRLDQGLAEGMLARQGAAQVVACGGSAFVAAARDLFAGAPGGFHAEAFSPPVVAESAGGEAQFFELRLAKSRRTLRVSSEQPLLEALEEAGLQPSYGCRMGICNSCSCRQASGETVNQLNGAALRGAGPLRLCVSRAQSNIELDL